GEACAAGPDQVQAGVIGGDDAGLGLERGLGVSSFARLRTVLFVASARRGNR
ncbi:MAG: hypothetical protein GY944_26590, partial [bacterium]|nr:hypothetical protein [bacterium]